MTQVSENYVDSFDEGSIELSTDGITYTDYSGWTAMLSQGGGGRGIGGAYTFDGDTELVTGGKRAHLVYTIRMIYVEQGSPNPYTVVESAYENKTDLYLRWKPFGGVSGNFRYTTTQGIVEDPPYPFGGEASKPDPGTFEFKLHVRQTTRDTYIG